MAKPPIALGFDAEWAERFEEIAAFDRVWCKVSGLVTEADWADWSPATFEPYIALARSAFGDQRLIFGSDWPVATLAADYAAVKDIAGRCFPGDPRLSAACLPAMRSTPIASNPASHAFP